MPAPQHSPHVLAVDIGGTKVDAAVITGAGEILRDSVSRRPTGRASSRAQLVEAISAVARAALDHLPDGIPLHAVGVGSAGPIDRRERAVYPLNLPHAHGLVLEDLLRDITDGARLELALDGTCIALAEHWLGALQGCENALAMVVSTGVGGGFIVNGMPAAGATGNAGHIGQLRVRTRDAADPLASTLEAIAAGPGTVAWARAQGWTGDTGEQLATSYESGDEIAVRAVARSATAVGEAIAASATLLDLEAVALAGGFINVAPDYVDRVAAAVRAASVHEYTRHVRVSRSSLGGDGPLLGAAALALSPAR